MYTFIREVTFRTMADMVKATPIMATMIKYYKEAHGQDMSLMHPVTGAPGRVRFVLRMDSLDKQRALQIKTLQDPVFQKLLAEMGPLVDGSRTFDDIWQ